MIKISKQKLVISFISLSCFFIGYYFAFYSYDAFNYQWYINNIHDAEARFYYEPGLVWFSKIILWLTNNGTVTTRILYGFSSFLLSLGILQFGYLVKSRLRVRSSFIVPLSFLLMFPLLILVVSTPRQAISIGFFCIAMCVLLNLKDDSVRNKGRLIQVGTLAACVFLSIAFHKLTFILAFICFAWIFISLPVFLLLVAVVSISVVSGLVLSASFQGLVNSMEGTVTNYLVGVNRDTGFFRMFVFVCVSLMFVFFAKKQALFLMNMGSYSKAKVSLLLIMALSAYVVISHDVARIVYLPVILLWMFVGISWLMPNLYIVYMKNNDK